MLAADGDLRILVQPRRVLLIVGENIVQRQTQLVLRIQSEKGIAARRGYMNIPQHDIPVMGSWSPLKVV